MAHKKALEALDRSLRDIRNNKTLMGGLPLILAGDFRQTLPVIAKGTKADEIGACLKYSRSIWPKVRTMRLTTNMRVHLYGDRESGSYAQLLLQIGNGTIPTDPEDGLINVYLAAQSSNHQTNSYKPFFLNFTSDTKTPPGLANAPFSLLEMTPSIK